VTSPAPAPALITNQNKKKREKNHEWNRLLDLHLLPFDLNIHHKPSVPESLAPDSIRAARRLFDAIPSQLQPAAATAVADG
jgi:hypothetical protein